VASSGFTCNAYACARTAEIAKTVSEDIVTVVGGQHFSFTPGESLSDYPEIDYIVRGEGEVTLVELIKALGKGGDLREVKGISFRHEGKAVHNPSRAQIEDMDKLPYPAYHLVENNVKNYHFTMMAGRNATYLVLEGSRGCAHKCTFCTQWNHWGGVWRTKSPKRIADEIEYLHDRFGGQFIWFADDNFDYGRRGKELWRELKAKKFNDEVMLFFQARTDDVANNPDLVSRLREVGNYWVMVGAENHSEARLKEYRKGIRAPDAYKAVKVLNDNDIFSHVMFVIGSREDTAESIAELRRFSLDLGSDFSIYTVLTPFPGTEYYRMAKDNGWIEDTNFANYDMAHAIMPTETLTRKQVQEELFICYNERYGSLAKNIAGVLSRKKLTRSLYRFMAKQNVLKTLRNLI
jgi:anaerobic magnesium-protoporphyrin IX monomethyl ester cyclase